MATYKDYLGSSYHYDELVRRLKSGEATLKTSETKSGSISQDEYGQYVWVPDEGGFAEAIPASDLNKYYDSETGQYRLTKQVPVSPYIDLGKNPMMGGFTEWPVQDLGNGNYQLSVMNSGENGYSNLVFNADSAGKPTLPESAPAFFQPYDSGNFFSDITGSALELATSDAGKMLALAAGAGVFSPAATGLTGYDAAMADLAASAPAFTPEAAAIAAPALTGVDAALADLAASAPAFTPEIIASPAIAPELTGVDAALADLAASAPAIAPEVIAAPVAAELTGVDAALADLANATPAFTGAELSVPAASGITLKGALDTARAGLLVNALTGDPLGLNDTGGETSAPTGFAQVPIPEDWKSPTYTYSPVQNVTFEDLFPAVSLQGTQWQNMPQAQTFNEMFASGQQQTPMGSPVDINQIVGSILGQSATS